jgi:hypothetical protein
VAISLSPTEELATKEASYARPTVSKSQNVDRPPRFWPNHHLHIVTNPNPVVIAVIGFITPTQPMKFLHAHAAFDRVLLSQVSTSCLIYCSCIAKMSRDAIVANRKSARYATVRRSFIYEWLGFISCCSDLPHPQNSNQLEIVMWHLVLRPLTLRLRASS